MKVKARFKAPPPRTANAPTSSRIPPVTLTPRLTVRDKQLVANRESYLESAVTRFSDWFRLRNGQDLPPVRVSCGFPGGRGSKRILGSCWDANAADDRRANIFISPLIDDTNKVLETLVHELVHACVGHDEGHGPGFAALARRVGLVGRMTATYAGTELVNYIAEVVAQLGRYPHAKLNLAENPVKKQTTRMIKCECPKTGYICRTMRKWLDLYGPPISPATKKPMVTDYIPAKSA